MLPHEITDRIIDFLWNDRRALCKCGLTSRSFFTRSRYHLLKSLHIQDRLAFDILVDRVLHAPPSRPYLEYTRHLTVVDDQKRPYAHSVPPVLGAHLTKITSLCFMNSRWHDRLHPLFFAQVSLFASVTQLNLFSCSFITFNDFLRLVGELRQLTDLHVYMLEILRQSFPHVLTRNSFRGANTLRLKSLELVELPWRELSCFFSWLVFAQFSRTIQTMVIRYPAEDWHSFTSHLIRSINVLQQGQTSLAMPVNHGLSGQERSPTDLVHLLQALHRLESAHLKEEEDVTGRQVLESDYVPGVVTKWTWSQYEDGLIENVHFSWGLDGVADLGNLLKDAGPSVTAFSMITSDLWWSFVPDAARNCLSFQYNTRLRTVRLHVQLEFSDSYELSWPTDLLAGLSPARVEDVHLYARVYFYEQLASFNWAKMDSILADAQFQSLKEVEIVLAIKAHISSPVLMPDHPRSAWETDDPLPAGKVDSSRTRKAVTLPPEWRTHNPSTAEFLDPGMPDMIRTALPKLASRGVLDIRQVLC